MMASADDMLRNSSSGTPSPPSLGSDGVEDFLMSAKHRQAIGLVRDVYAAPWSNDQSHTAFARDMIDYVISHPRPGATRTAEARP